MMIDVALDAERNHNWDVRGSDLPCLFVALSADSGRRRLQTLCPTVYGTRPGVAQSRIHDCALARGTQ